MKHIHILGDGENREEKNVRLFADENGVRKAEQIEDNETIRRLKDPERGIAIIGHVHHTQAQLLGELKRHMHHQIIHSDEIEIVNIGLQRPHSEETIESQLLTALTKSEIPAKEFIFISPNNPNIELRKATRDIASFAVMLIENTRKDLDKLDIEAKQMLEKEYRPYDPNAKNYHKFHNQKPSGPKGIYGNSRRR